MSFGVYGNHFLCPSSSLNRLINTAEVALLKLSFAISSTHTPSIHRIAQAMMPDSTPSPPHCPPVPAPYPPTPALITDIEDEESSSHQFLNAMEDSITAPYISQRNDLPSAPTTLFPAAHPHPQSIRYTTDHDETDKEMQLQPMPVPGFPPRLVGPSKQSTLAIQPLDLTATPPSSPTENPPSPLVALRLNHPLGRSNPGSERRADVRAAERAWRNQFITLWFFAQLPNGI